MDFGLSCEEHAVLNDALRVCPALADRAADADQSTRFPREDLMDLHRANLMALAVPVEYGGRGASLLACTLACERLASANASVAIAWVMHTACGWEIAGHAHPETRDHVLKEVVSRGAMICIAGAEGRHPDGSPCPLSVTPEGENWRLQGRKGYVSGSEAAVYVLTGGKTSAGEHQSFILPMETPGLSIADPWDGMGMRASASHGLAFDGVVLPESCRLPGSDKTGDFRNTSALFGLGLAATGLGLARASVEFTLQWSRRKALSETARNRLGDMAIKTDAARALLWQAAWTVDHCPETGESWVDRAKTLAVETAQSVTVDAMRVCGGSSFRTRYPLERYVRDASALLLQGQRPDMLRIAVADHLLSEPSAREGDLNE